MDQACDVHFTDVFFTDSLSSDVGPVMLILKLTTLEYKNVEAALICPECWHM